MAFPKSWSPFLAILETDLRTMTHSWVIRGWALLLAFQFLFSMAGVSNEFTPASEALTGMLAVFPIIWSTVIILLCSGAVSSESGVIADSILSKAVTRYQYILAKFSSRLLIMLGIYFTIAIAGALVMSNNALNDMTTAGVVWGILSIAMMILLLTSLAVGFSTVFNRTIIAFMVVWVIWYIVSGLLALFKLEYLSPLDIVEHLPATLRGEYKTTDQLRIVVLFGLLSALTIGGAVSHFARKDL